MSIHTRKLDPILAISPTKSAPHCRWYDGAIFYVLVQIMTISLSGLVSALKGQPLKSIREAFGDVDYFRNLHQSVITPPSWAFGPAWTINNFSVIWGNLRVLNKPAGTPGRTPYLALQGASWVMYVIFSAAYFSLRSPLNALVITLSMFALTILSGFVAIFRLKDTAVALSLATLFIWLIIASTAAAFQAAWNYDDFYRRGPFVEPDPALEKNAQ